MKKFYLVIIIIAAGVATSIVMTPIMFEKPNAEYAKIISITYIPSYYKGVIKNVPDHINHIDNSLNLHPVILESIEKALEIPVPMKRNDPVRQGITSEHNDVKYYIIQTGPQAIRVETSLTEKNYEEVKQWSSVNLNVDYIQYDIEYYDIKYKNELFFMKIGDESIIMENEN